MQWERMGSDRVWPLTCGGGGGGGGSSISTASPTDGRRLRTACAHLHQAHLTPAASATRVRQYRRTRTAYTRYTGMCVAAARGRRESVCVVAASGRGALLSVHEPRTRAERTRRLRRVVQTPAAALLHCTRRSQRAARPSRRRSVRLRAGARACVPHQPSARNRLEYSP
jgi:hypothetical protein